VLDMKKIERCKRLLLEEYFNSSVLESTVDAVDYSDGMPHNLKFKKFGRWTYIPEDWFTDPTIFPDMVFAEVGRGIALGEEKYIIKQILENKEIESKQTVKFDYAELLSLAEQLGFSENMFLFVPIEYFVPINVDWTLKRRQIRIEKNDFYLGDLKIKVLWSSNYLKFDKIILAKKTFGRWVAKPNVRNRLEVEVMESKQKMDQLELKAQTVFNFRIMDARQVRVISAPFPQKNHK
jgi:hypothetical protein